MSWSLRRTRPSRMDALHGRSVSTRLSRMRPWDFFVRELDRSRRFDRPLSLLQVRPTSGVELDAAMVSHIESTLRSIDLAWIEANALCVTLPETDRNAAEQVRQRIIEDGRQRSIELDISYVSFPDDGVTAGALLGALNGRSPGEATWPGAAASADRPGAAAGLMTEDT